MNYEGERFLLKLYRELYNEEEVKHSGTKSDDKFELINKYMKRLEKSAKVFDGDHYGLEKYMRERYYDRYVIKEEDIPASYYELQKRIALERGYGHVEYTSDMKHQEASHIIEEQKRSLDKWLDYLMKENTTYPMWARYWAFQGMLKLGMYDKEKNAFTRRSKGTTSPFIELNPEALSYAIETVTLYQNGKEIDDEELKKLVESGNFGKIYSHNLWKIANDAQNKDNNDSLEGKWIKYQKGDTQEVVKALSGKGTGWCIAGESTAQSYLSRGTFDIYFTKDSQGEYTNPRACIRTENESIAEVRGINKDQNMEPEMVDIVDKKLDEFPDKEEYKKKVRDMNKLTEIYNKAMSNKELTREEILFIFEVNGSIDGFGWRRDPRIEEIKEKTIVKDKDIAMNIIRKRSGTSALLYLSEELRTLLYFSEELRNDREVVLEAVKGFGVALEYASEELQNDREIVLVAVRRNGDALQYASKRLKDDKEMVLEAVKQDGSALQYASERLQDDKEVVLAAIKQNGFAIQFASERLKNDEDLVIEALKSEGCALKVVSERWKDDKKKVLLAVKQDGRALEYASERLQDDKEIVLAAVKNNGWLFRLLSPELRDDKEVALAAINKVSIVLGDASERLRNDKEVVLAAIRKDSEALCFAGDEIKRDRDFMISLILDSSIDSDVIYKENKCGIKKR